MGEEEALIVASVDGWFVICVKTINCQLQHLALAHTITIVTQVMKRLLRKTLNNLCLPNPLTVACDQRLQHYKGVKEFIHGLKAAIFRCG